MPPRWTEHALTVTELTLRLQRDLEPRYRRLEVRGEVTGARRVAAGHLYFTLKDEGAQLPCVVWRSTLARSPARVEDGQKVVVTGDLQLHPPQGRYQLIGTRVVDIGLGDELVKLEELKRRLLAEGLFSPERKRPLPAWPRRIGLVTALGGAALHDFAVAAQGRLPCDIVLCTCRVQGELAARSIVGALRVVSRWPGVELVVLTRGGGSAIDLMPFSDERVVRQIAASPVPVVSAVGHEIDVSLADLVADLRAMTPTAAAEAVLKSRREVHVRLETLARTRARLLERQLGDRGQRLDFLVERSESALERRLAIHQRTLATASARLERSHPRARLSAMRARHQAVCARLDRVGDRLVRRLSERLELASERLRLLSPLASLDRGWALVRREDGSLLRSVTDTGPGATVDIALRDGNLKAIITATTSAAPTARSTRDEEPP